MRTENAACPPEPVLADFGLGKLDDASSDTITEHLETCADCRQRVASLPGDSFIALLRNVPGHAAGAGLAPPRIDHTFVAGESADDSSGAETAHDEPLREARGLKPVSPFSPALAAGPVGPAPPELANHPDYELLKELGRGGMGVVYLARNRIMDRLEVLKVVNKVLLDRPEAQERFQQEIRSAARLSHPNIVAAHCVLRPGDLLVFAMEYVHGQDLSQVVKARGQLPVAHAACYTHQVALGLQHAHEKGMVHRDIKPSNLMLAVEGKTHMVKILDFGLSKATSEKGAEAGLTKSGQILGTPDYVAPEQTLNAQKADIRADIYSLGCTLYHLLSGGPPFQESSLYAILEAHQKRDPRPLNLVRSDAPGPLAEVVAKMMAKDPDNRFQTPIEVARALAPFFEPGQMAATTDLPPCADAHRRSATGVSSPTHSLASHDHPALVATPLVATVPVAFPQSTPVVAIDRGLPSRAAIERHAWWSRLPPWARLAAAGAAAALVLLGIVLLVRTPHGTIAIELSDPKAKVTVTVDGDHVDIAGLDGPLSLEVREHDLVVRGEGYETVTERFTVTKGKNAPLAVTLRKTNAPPANGDMEFAAAPFSAAQAVVHQDAWAKHLGTKIEIENSLGMKLRLIPPGEFAMGSTQAEIDALVQSTNEKTWQNFFRSQGPRHRVHLTKAFYLASCEVTQRQYQEVMGENPSFFSQQGKLANAVKDLDTGQHPVENVNWFKAVEFCNRLSEREQLPPYYARDGRTVTRLGGTGYRLPTDAEWEYACRAGTTTRWSFGDNETELAQHAWIDSNAGGRTHRVAELPANPFGLFDLYGNVWEWCWDWHDEYAAEAVSDPSGPSTGTRRVFRGGSCYGCLTSACRSASHKGWYFPKDGWGNVGFRVARTIDVKVDAPPRARDTDQKAASVKPPSLAVAPFDARQAVAHQEAWAKHLGTQVEIENSLQMKLRLIPPGDFVMGSPPDEIDALAQSTTDQNYQFFFHSEGPQNRVKLAQAFYLGDCEVTQR
ncbi:MAG TPA: SUMF1/EgtB/PvdO family nonheme iron enzyme, partial [Pirellulales bacterium]|nr:SUMF1/EgtB/PvdO family nonheme iron enzyme [Pirellulales bacterium]